MDRGTMMILMNSYKFEYDFNDFDDFDYKFDDFI